MEIGIAVAKSAGAQNAGAGIKTAVHFGVSSFELSTRESVPKVAIPLRRKWQRLLKNVHSPGGEKGKNREGNERLQHSCQLSPSRENRSVSRRKGGARVERNK
jgi:hypothetical protein